MVTLIRWILLKQKEIKLKLAFYSAMVHYMEEISSHKEELLNTIYRNISDNIVKSWDEFQKNEKGAE